jgi:hypothetical protein
MNSFSRLVTASGFLARSVDMMTSPRVPVIGFDWRSDPPAEDADAAFVQCLLGIASISGGPTDVT